MISRVFYTMIWYKTCLNWTTINEITAKIIFTDHSYLPPVCSDGGAFSVHTTFALMSFDLSAIPIVCDALGCAIIILTCSILLGHATCFCHFLKSYILRGMSITPHFLRIFIFNFCVIFLHSIASLGSLCMGSYNKLQHIQVSDNQIVDIDLVKCLSKWPVIRYKDLAGNNITVLQDLSGLQNRSEKVTPLTVRLTFVG